jgi:hypothetical protein
MFHSGSPEEGEIIDLTDVDNYTDDHMVGTSVRILLTPPFKL